MSRSSRKAGKIIAGAVAFLLIGLLLFVTVSFVGNPISAARANHAVKDYIAERYGDLDLEITRKAKYNFKDESYSVIVQSKSSPDTRFDVAWRRGTILYDDYDLQVLQYSNTLQRLSNEYSARVTKLVQDQLGNYKSIRVIYNFEDAERHKELLELDMKFDPSLAIATAMYVEIGLEENEEMSLTALAEKLSGLHRLMKDNGYSIAQYNAHMEQGESLIIAYVPAAEIEDAAGLAHNLEQAVNNNGEYKGISVIMKGNAGNDKR